MLFRDKCFVFKKKVVVVKICVIWMKKTMISSKSITNVGSMVIYFLKIRRECIGKFMIRYGTVGVYHIFHGRYDRDLYWNLCVNASSRMFFKKDREMYRKLHGRMDRKL